MNENDENGKNGKNGKNGSHEKKSLDGRGSAGRGGVRIKSTMFDVQRRMTAPEVCMLYKCI